MVKQEREDSREKDSNQESEIFWPFADLPYDWNRYERSKEHCVPEYLSDCFHCSALTSDQQGLIPNLINRK